MTGMQGTRGFDEARGGCRKEINFRPIPFQLGAEIAIKSLSNASDKAKTRVCGVINGQLIMIEEPLFSLLDRSSKSEPEFLCIYLYENSLFKFKSKFKKHLYMNVIGIEYPDEYEKIQIRTSTRIKVDLEAKAVVRITGSHLDGKITDISEGGCCLELSEKVSTAKGDGISLTFSLPDGRCVEKLAGIIRNFKQVSDQVKTAVGLSFSSPNSEAEKVRNFCRLCSCVKYMNTLEA